MSNIKILFFSLILTSAIIFIYGNAFGDGGNECRNERALSALEKNTALKNAAILKSSVPAPPKGWKLNQLKGKSDIPEMFNDCPEYNLGYSDKILFMNEQNIGDNTNHMLNSKVNDRITEMTNEMNEAIAKNDMKKVEMIGKKMATINSEVPRNMTLTVEFNINMNQKHDGIYEATPISIQGAKFAFKHERSNEKYIILYLGKWEKSGNNVSPKFSKSVSNTVPQVIEIIITGELAEDIAGKINLKTANSILK